MTRIEGVTETLRHALNALASTAPEWLLAHTAEEWVDRYSPRASDYRLPKGKAKRQAYAEQVGADGMTLLEAISTKATPGELRGLPAVELLRRAWIQNFKMVEGRVRWRQSGEIPPTGLFVSSPYDPGARYATKRTMSWTGYKVHLTETCDDERPNLITAVATTAASVSDDAVTASIHASLAERNLLPEKHIADTDFVNAPLFARGLGNATTSSSSVLREATTSGKQRRGQALPHLGFVIDWDQKESMCPEEKSEYEPGAGR